MSERHSKAVPADDPIHHAPSERTDGDAVARLKRLIESAPLVQSLLESFPEYVVILNRQRQICACNRAFLEALGAGTVDDILGKKPGELFGCVHCDETPGGCGASEACMTCGGLNAVMECVDSSAVIRHECTMETRTNDGPGMWELGVVAAPIEVDGESLIVFAVRDVADRNRRIAMERIFFHDVLNVAGAIQTSAMLIDSKQSGNIEKWSTRIKTMSRQLVAQIQDQRDLAAAERGEFKPSWDKISARELLANLRATYIGNPIARDCDLDFRAPSPPELEITSDPVLLERVLGNLTKNALEASPSGGTVTVTSCLADDDSVAFSVHNETAMSGEVQLQVFKRSFSTKAGTDRGLGTFSVKLLTTRYLKGSVGFTSSEEAGTTFTVTLPVYPSEAEG